MRPIEPNSHDSSPGRARVVRWRKLSLQHRASARRSLPSPKPSRESLEDSLPLKRLREGNTLMRPAVLEMGTGPLPRKAGVYAVGPVVTRAGAAGAAGAAGIEVAVSCFKAISLLARILSSYMRWSLR